MSGSIDALFLPGRLVITTGADAAIDRERLLELLKRHLRGDWGCKHPEDAASNDEGLASGEGRLMSTYAIDPGKPYGTREGNMVWVITEWDRSVTTFLLPDEY